MQRSPCNSARGPGCPHPLNRNRPRTVRSNAGSGATSFLMATIKHGGNIHHPTSQETHYYCDKEFSTHVSKILCHSNSFGAVRKRSFSVGCCLCSLLWWSAPAPAADSAAASGREPAKRSRVVMAQEPDATVAFSPQPEKIPPIIQRGLTLFTGKPTLAEAWRSLVSTQDTVGIKVFSAPGPTRGTRPAVVEAVVKGLLAAGQPPRQVVVWDKHLSDLRQARCLALAE